MNIFELSTEILEIEAMLTDAEGDVSDEAFEEMVDRYFGQKQEFGKKLDNYAMLIRALSERQAIRTAESKRLAELAKRDEITVQRLDSRLVYILEKIGGVEKKYDTDRNSFSICTAGGVAPLVVPPDLDLNTIDQKYVQTEVKTTKKLDGTLLREDLAKGVELEWAKLGERKRYVKVK